jgi:biotin carboxylase
MKKQKLMILGAAKFTVPLIELAKRMDYETIVVSIAGNYPGFLVADKTYEVDVRDKEKILEIARKEGISGIVTDQTDLPVPTIAYVAEKMGLPGIGYDCALRITNKLMCRKHCQRMGFPVPAFYHASNLEEARKGAREIGFPLVVKPSDSMAARGVSKVNNLAELERKFNNAFASSTSGVVLLEKYFHGRKIILTGFIADYQFTNLILADHKHFDIVDLFIVRQTTVPSNLDQQLLKKILELNIRIFESFGARFGIAFSEFKVNEESGEVSLMEAALRGPAGYVSSHVTPLACGIDILPMLIELATARRETVSIDKDKLHNHGAGNVYFYLPEGVVSKIAGIEEVKSLPGVRKVELGDLAVGKKIDPIINMSGRQGPIIYAGKDRKECEDIIKKIKDILVVEVKTPEGVKGMIWS